MIRFFLNRETTVRFVTPSPDLTVLDYLRHNGFVGSKEGCAAGDCGACTAVLVEVKNGAVAFTAVNTCITFLSALDGKLLITVEGLAGKAALHPVQQAMINEHGSQCGFCTPGFVMSLFAMTKNPPPENTREAIADSLAGNLCRCTGYLPIIRAATALLQNPQQDDDDDILTKLQTFPAAPPIANDDICIATNEAQLSMLRQQYPTARPLGGGTDLALETTQQERAVGQKIDFTRVAEWKTIEDNAAHWRIGAAVTVAEFAKFCADHLPVMVPFLKRFGSPPIRACATVGGNIGNASPIGDLPPPFLALNASLVLNANGNERHLPLDEFFLAYKKTALKAGEWVSAVLLPKPAANAIYTVYKISKRLDDDISAVCGAFYWQLNGEQITAARLAFGGMAATPKRAAHCEQAFIGKPWSAETFAAAADTLVTDFTPLTDMRASAGYRLQVAGGILKRAYLESQQTLLRMEAIWA